MGRSSVYNVHQLPDAAQVWNFDLRFPSIPGGGDAVALTYKCQSSSIPGFNLESIDIELHGVKKKEAGRATYEHTLQCTFLETVDYATRDGFRKWRETCRSWKRNTGSVSSAYKVNGLLELYDNTPAVTRSVVIYGMYPETVDSLALENSSTACFLSVTFSFDWTDE